MDPEQILDPAAPAPSTGSESAPDVTAQAVPDSSSGKDEEKKTLLEAVRSAVDASSIEDEDAPLESVADSAAEPSTAEGEKSPDEAAKPEIKDDVSDDALLAALDKLKADVPLHKIERFREVITENRQLKASNERYTQLDQTLTDIGNDARRMGLTNDELAQLFAWPRLLAKDPHAAVEQIQTFSARWQERVGASLPADLKQKVDDGLLDADIAKEVAQLRASKALGETRSTAEAQDREHEVFQRTRKEIETSVNAYQEELRRTDPDYTPDKHAMVRDSLTSLVAVHGVPTTVADARALAKLAYDTVSQRLVKLRPPPRQVQTPTVGRRLNKPAESQPKTFAEAVAQAVGGE